MALCLFGCVRDRYPAVYLKKAGLFYWTRDAWFCMSVSQTQNLVKFPACSWTGQWSRKPWGSSTRYKLQLWVDDCVLEAPEQDLTSLGASKHIKTACEWRQASCGWDCEPLESGSWDAGPILRCSCHVLFATTSVSLTAPYFENSKRLLNTGPYWPHCFGIFGVICDICDLCFLRNPGAVQFGGRPDCPPCWSFVHFAPWWKLAQPVTSGCWALRTWLKVAWQNLVKDPWWIRA